VSDDLYIEDLRDDIDETRDNLGATLNQLEERLAPERLQQDTTDIVREVADKIIAEVQGRTGDLTQQITDQIHAAVHSAATTKSEEMMTQAAASIRTAGASLLNRTGSSPAPVALAAVGIGLLAATSAKGSSSSNTSDGSAQSGSGVMSTVDNLLGKANSVAERATNGMSGASQESGKLFDQAKSMIGNTPQSPDQVRGLVSDKPLVVGLLALGLGAAMGLSIPGTTKEREATSTLRTQAQDKLGAMGIADNPQGMIDQAKQGLSQLSEKIGESATTGLDLAKQATGEVASSAKETAAAAASDKGLTR